jgi:acetate kinase
MRVLVVNAGSSSCKLSVVGPTGDAEAAATIEQAERAGDAWDPAAFDAFLRTAPEFGAVGHRVVHGGTDFRDPEPVTPAVEEALLALAPLAPLHQPRAVEGMRTLRRLCPDSPQFACFDTAFHATLAPPAFTYALPESWRERWGIRRFGFHGLSHAYATARVAELVGRAGDASLRVVCCHLGSGASLCATRGGRSVDTTMGWTPLEGLVMATRAGSVDPGAVLALVRALGVDAVEAGLDRASGLAGLSGIADGDLRAVLAAREAGEAAAALAFDVYVHRLRREIGAMVANLGGLDALVFTGGVGEHAAGVRAAACETLGFLGVALDACRNTDDGGQREIGASGAAVRTFVVVAREDVEIARQVRSAVSGGRPAG